MTRPNDTIKMSKRSSNGPVIINKKDYANQLKMLKETKRLKLSGSRPKAKNQLRKKINWEYQHSVNRLLKTLLPDPPFAIGIDKDLIAILSQDFESKTRLRKAVRRHLHYLTSRNEYLALLAVGKPRNHVSVATPGLKYHFQRIFAAVASKKIDR